LHGWGWDVGDFDKSPLCSFVSFVVKGLVFNFGDFWQSWQFLQSLFGFAFPITAMTCDVGDSPEPPESPVLASGVGFRRFSPPPGLFFSRVENKGRTANRPKGDPCVALG
jgi:hypothetical protein